MATGESGAISRACQIVGPCCWLYWGGCGSLDFHSLNCPVNRQVMATSIWRRGRPYRCIFTVFC